MLIAMATAAATKVAVADVLCCVVVPTVVNTVRSTKKMKKHLVEAGVYEAAAINTAKKKEQEAAEAIIKEQVETVYSHSNVAEHIKPEITKTEVHSIVNICDGNKEKIDKNLEVANKTNNILNYVYHYITNDNAQLVNLPDKDQEFANGVAEYLGFGKMYFDKGSLDVRKFNLNNMTSYTYKDNDFLLDINVLNDKIKDQNFMMLVKLRRFRFYYTHSELMQRLPMNNNFPGNGTTLPDGTYMPNFSNFTNSGFNSPISFQNPAENTVSIRQANHPHKPVNIPDEIYERFEKYFGPYFIDKSLYYYDISPNGLYRINVYTDSYDPDGVGFFIDDGSIMGGTMVSIFGIHNDNMIPHFYPIPVTDQFSQLIYAMFNSAPYYLDDNDLNYLYYNWKYFNFDLYKYIDFSNTEFVDKILADKDEYFKFQNQLMSAIKNISKEDPANSDIMFRIEGFKDSEHFYLVSDDKVSTKSMHIGYGTGKIKNIIK